MLSPQLSAQLIDGLGDLLVAHLEGSTAILTVLFLAVTILTLTLTQAALGLIFLRMNSLRRFLGER